MKKTYITLSFLLCLSFLFAQNLKPYQIVLKTNKQISTLQSELIQTITDYNFEVVGHYAPANDPNRSVIIFTCDELQKAVETIGGLSGFAATLRIGITNENGHRVVSVTTPQYWGNAYFQSNYERVESHYSTLNDRLTKAFSSYGKYFGTSYGSEDGLSPKALRKYHYMMGMPYFDDNIVLAEYSSFTEAVESINANISDGIPNVNKVYEVSLVKNKIALYGFGLSGENGENQFVPIIDIDEPKHTAFLPYEILVFDNKIYMLHGRYRIALSFPDLTMGTFSKIMATPGNIEDLLKQVVK